MKVGESFLLPVQLRGGDFDFDCRLVYASEQVLRFQLRFKTQEMELQKMLLIKTRFKWKLTNSNFEFKKAHAGENLNTLFHRLDGIISNPPSLPEYLKNKKSW